MLAIKTMITDNREAEFAIANFFSPKKKVCNCQHYHHTNPLGRNKSLDTHKKKATNQKGKKNF
jgi:hypothetical protein